MAEKYFYQILLYPSTCLTFCTLFRFLLCYGLDMKSPPKIHVLKIESPLQQYSELGPWGSDHEDTNLIKGLIHDG